MQTVIFESEALEQNIFFPVSPQSADLSVLSPWNDPAAELKPQPFAGLAKGVLFLSADVSQTVWLYKGLLHAD